MKNILGSPISTIIGLLMGCGFLAVRLIHEGNIQAEDIAIATSIIGLGAVIKEK